MALDIFLEISIIIIIAAFFAGLMRVLKQPLIIGYILTGIIISPYFLNFIDSTPTVSTFSHIGISILLFMVGLNLNVKMVKSVGAISVITGLGQILFTSLIGFTIASFLGFSPISAIYIAIAISFSSTIIIMKLLYDKNDVDSLYGRISIGFLLVQDIVAVFIILMISSMDVTNDYTSLVIRSIVSLIALVSIIFLVNKYVIEKILNSIAKSQEFLLLFSIAWCFLLASVFNLFNFSIEFGALLAGITLGSTNYKFEISNKLKPLRDFFIILFFVMLGSQLIFENVASYIIPILIFSLFILIGNPIIVMTLMGFFGYSKRNGFLAGLTVSQVSEFSLIVITMGISMGHINQDVLSLLTAIALLTITGSSYTITFSNKIYPKISRYLTIFERKKIPKVDEMKHHKGKEHEVLLFGYNQIGTDLLNSLKKLKKEFLIIDYNPDKIIDLSRQGFDCKFGDVNDSELLGELDLFCVKLVISTIPDTELNLFLIEKIREINKEAIIIIISHQIDDAITLYEKGATYVILPHFLGGYHASTMIEKYGLDIEQFLEQKINHIEYLNKRKNLKNHSKHL
ncbi:sodium:proton exchanger [Candidatus Woesearchaeota archaeon]|nr:MAG: sodium:proton exchanger [Candidatus Woesearchaeota archaeon]